MSGHTPAMLRARPGGLVPGSPPSGARCDGKLPAEPAPCSPRAHRVALVAPCLCFGLHFGVPVLRSKFRSALSVRCRDVGLSSAKLSDAWRANMSAWVVPAARFGSIFDHVSRVSCLVHPSHRAGPHCTVASALGSQLTAAFRRRRMPRVCYRCTGPIRLLL